MAYSACGDADSNDTAEIAAFQKAQHDVIAGIKAAETASGGKAVSADGRMVYWAAVYGAPKGR